MKAKAWFSIASSVLAVSLLTAGCSSGSNVGGSESGGQKKEVVIWDWTDPYKTEISGPMDTVIAEYNKENPDVELKIEKITNDSIRTKLLAAISANNLPDAAFLDGQWLAEFQSTGILAALNNYTDEWGQSDDFPEKVWESVVFDGQVYGIPGDGDVRTLLYRKDLLDKVGLEAPKTWSELVTASKKLMEVGKSEGIEYGFAMNGGNSEHTSMRSLPWIWDLGGDFVDGSGKPTLTSEPIVKTVQFMSDLVLKDKVSPPDSYMKTKKEVAASIVSGQSAMAIVGSWEWRSDASFLAQDSLKGKLASAPIPLPDDAVTDEPATAVGYGTWVIFDNSQNKDEAWKWIEKVTSPEHEINIFKNGTGNMPMRLSAYKDEAFTSDPIFKSFVDIMPYARPRPKTETYEALSQAYRDAIQLVLGKQKPVQEALDYAQSKVESQ
ncbi:ABC transporter substrate-binding protein [Cohnella massiliensis]|nr:sugar ABC transporter substrate-binding protein [Cohnella massiliensis]